MLWWLCTRTWSSLLLSLLSATLASSEATTTTTNLGPSYNICNGLSNQLLQHASAIAWGIEQHYQYNNVSTIRIPNHFIAEGVQWSNDAVRPSWNNSIPLSLVFDTPHLLQTIQELGNINQHQQNQHDNDNDNELRAILVSLDDALLQNSSTQEPCIEFNVMSKANPQVVMKVLQAFRPSTVLQQVIDTILFNIQHHHHGRNFDLRQGVCLHHRNGPDWHIHCERWSTIPWSTIYRGNCLPIRHQTLVESLWTRGLSPDSPEPVVVRRRNRVVATTSTTTADNNEDHKEEEEEKEEEQESSESIGKWAYYCGDYNGVVPQELRDSERNGFEVISRQDIISSSLTRVEEQEEEEEGQPQKEVKHTAHAVIANLLQSGGLELVPTASTTTTTTTTNVAIEGEEPEEQDGDLGEEWKEDADPTTRYRDLWALIDFFVCQTFDTFIGNSVSTFSAIQLALRGGEGTYWYNSQSIPMGDFWPVFPIPIVYTYTELSEAGGKALLQTSIATARHHMPDTPIHVLYHGTDDEEFRDWLQDKAVILHDHRPLWQKKIEKMRLNGNSATSHLYLHRGNFLGTWQRIDIPLFLNTEYCLYLDADTLIARPFTLADFGLDITYGVAMTDEVAIFEDWAVRKMYLNAGVTLMNVPFLRQTHRKYKNFIFKHVPTGGKYADSPAPADQGAALVFYDKMLGVLPREFNMKPYWDSDAVTSEPFIWHFHGAKPHDYLKHALGRQNCSQAIEFICRKIAKPNVCKAFQVYAKAAHDTNTIDDFCNSSFFSRTNTTRDSNNRNDHGDDDDDDEVGKCIDLTQRLAGNSKTCSDLLLEVTGRLGGGGNKFSEILMAEGRMMVDNTLPFAVFSAFYFAVTAILLSFLFKKRLLLVFPLLLPTRWRNKTTATTTAATTTTTTPTASPSKQVELQRNKTRRSISHAGRNL